MSVTTRSTEFVPLLQRKVIINHGKPMTELLISDLKTIAGRWDDIGQQLYAIREGPVRYSTLQRPLQATMLDFALFMRRTISTFEALLEDNREHQHEFQVELRSVPRHF